VSLPYNPDMKITDVKTGPRPDLDELFREPLAFQDGQITLPDRPGLGLEIDEKKLAKATR
jgi:L-alanine-DL-glutamate epimerase-like enolase superfamily enzyme